MLENPAFNENNEKILCEMNGKNPEMHKNIWVKKLAKGEKYEIFSAENETAVLILKGNMNISWNDRTENMKRKNQFEKTPYCLHVCKGIKISIEACEDSEFLVQQTDNEREFEPVFYKPEDCLYQHFGKGQWEGTGYRIC